MEKKRVVLITEAGNGLALKFASILKHQGFDIIIAAKGNSYAELKALNLEDIKLLEIDLTNTEGVVQLYSHIKTAYRKLDVLINNAEIGSGFGQKITELNIHDVRKLYDENLFSVIELTKNLFKLLIKSENAFVINITSGLGDIAKMKDETFSYSDYKMTAYSTAKAALDMLTALLEKEFKPTNISVKSFDPVRLKNSTHNSVEFCEGVKNEFLGLIDIKAFEELI